MRGGEGEGPFVAVATLVLLNLVDDDAVGPQLLDGSGKLLGVLLDLVHGHDATRRNGAKEAHASPAAIGELRRQIDVGGLAEEIGRGRLQVLFDANFLVGVEIPHDDNERE